METLKEQCQEIFDPNFFLNTLCLGPYVLAETVSQIF